MKRAPKLSLTALEGRRVPATFTVTNLDDAGAGSLRQAVLDANAAAGADVIEFDAGVAGTVTLTSGEIAITDDLDINGPGTAGLAVDGDASDRIFLIDDGDAGRQSLVQIDGLTLQNGSAPADGGGAIFNRGGEGLVLTNSALTGNTGGAGSGGAVLSYGGAVELYAVAVTGNTALYGGGVAQTGGVLDLDAVTLTGNTATADGGAVSATPLAFTLRNSDVANNTAGGDGGGLFIDDAAGSALIENSVITGNDAGGGSGGGVDADFVSPGDGLTLADSSVTGNTADANGGGVALTGAGFLDVRGSEISGNDAAAGTGGGVFFNGDSRGSFLRLGDSTVSANDALASAGGGVHFYSGLASLEVTDSTISGNTASASGGGLAVYYGGGSGVHDGTFLIRDTEVSGNAAGADGGGVLFAGDDFYNPVRVERSVISGNDAGGDGGGLFLYADDGFYGGVIIEQSTVSGNAAGADGGGVFFYDDDSDNVLAIDGSTVSENTAGGDGGGLFLYADDNYVYIRNTTVSGNVADGDGGGVFVEYAGDYYVRLQNSTVARNTASTGTGGGIFSNDDILVQGTIVGDNAAGTDNDIAGPGTFSLEFSLIEDVGGAIAADRGPSITGADPRIGPLGDNGGPTMTHLPQDDSPVIDAGLNFAAAPFDQTGVARTIGDFTDIGAVEGGDLPPANPVPTFTVTNADGAGAGSLRQAVLDANAAFGPDVIDFDPGLAGSTITLAGEIVIEGDDLTILGLGSDSLTVDGGGATRLFNIDEPAESITVEISGLTLSGGDVAGDGAAVLAGQDESLFLRDSVLTGNTATNNGGAVSIEYGLLRVWGTTFSGNTAGNNGGAIAAASASVAVRDSALTGNTATQGGAFYAEDGFYARPTVFENTQITGNNAEAGGGLFFGDPDGSILLDGSTVTTNGATVGDGGGVHVAEFDYYGPALTVRATTVSQNTAAARGGGLFLGTDRLEASVGDSTVAANTAGTNGGGIAFLGDEGRPRLAIRGSTVTDNEATAGGGGGVFFYSDGADLEVLNSTIDGNTAAADGAGLNLRDTSGGFRGSVLIESSSVSGNAAGDDGGGVSASPAAAEAPFRVLGSTVSGNTSGGEGGGLRLFSAGGFLAGVRVEGSTVSGNTSEEDGGGLFFYDGLSDQALDVVGSTVSGNTTSAGDGGGVFLYSQEGQVRVRNSTVSGNGATAGDGGGVFVSDTSPDDAVRIQNSTIALNDAPAGNGGGVFAAASVRVEGSAVALNTADSDADLSSLAAGDEVFALFSLIQDAGAADLVDGGRNVFGEDPMFGPLQDNGGLTDTHLPQAGSPALDAGFNFAALPADQRGFNRAVNGFADIGAAESQPSPSATLVSSENPAQPGDVVTFTFTLTDLVPGSNTPVGVVNFFEGATLVATEPLSAGLTATYVTDALPVGNTVITAEFVGDPPFGDVDAPPLNQVIESPPGAPTAEDDLFEVAPGETLTVAAPGILENDTDPDGDAITVFDPDSVVLQSGNGELTVNADGSFTFTPGDGFAGLATFAYRATDGALQSDAATVTILVGAPLAEDDTFTTPVDTGFTVEAPGILFNDSDPDGDPLDVFSPEGIVLTSGEGTLTVNADGSFTFTPAAGFVGTATFQYAASDGQLLSNLATVTIEVVESAGSPGDQNKVDRFAIGAGPGGGQAVQVVLPGGGDDPGNFTVAAFDAAEAPGGVRVAQADVNGDGVADIVAATGPGSPNLIRVIDGDTQAVLYTVQPFEAAFTGGLFVAAGDLDGDGNADIIVTPDVTGGPRVAVLDGETGGRLRGDFFGIEDPDFRGGARPSVGDVNGDGVTDVIIAAGFTGGPRVALFDGASLLGAPQGATPPKVTGDFFVFEQSLRNGAFVGAGDIDADGNDDLFAGGGPGGAPRVRAFGGAALQAGGFDPFDPSLTPGVQLVNFFAGDVDNRGGVRVVSKDFDGDAVADLIAAAGTDAAPIVSRYSGADLADDGSLPELDSFLAFDAAFTNGVFVG